MGVQKISPVEGGGPATSTVWGHDMAAIGDLDGDGVTEVAVADIFNDTGGTDRGAVHIMFMNADGTVRSTVQLADGINGVPANTLGDSDQLGFSMEPLGDWDGDGVTELAVGARVSDIGGPNRGALHILRLNADGTAKAVDTIADGVGGLPSGTLVDGEYFGSSARLIGDLDGDGTEDLVVGAYRRPLAGLYVLFMNPDLTVKSFTHVADGVGGLAVGTIGAGNVWGYRIADVDLNGDGRVELIVTDELDDTAATNGGAAWTLFLNADGTVASQVKLGDGVGGIPAGVITAGDLFGSAADPVGDLDGDGIGDVLFGERYDDTGGTNRGAIHIAYMAADGTVDHLQKIADGVGLPAGTLADGDGFGWSATTNLGDLDGNGFDDLGVTALFDDDGGTDAGAMYVLFMSGDSDGDGVFDHVDEDDDNDGIPDVVEHGGDPTADADNDGIPNHLDSDSDGDGIADVVEAGGSDPDGDGTVGVGRVITDLDGDGIDDSVDTTGSSTGTALPLPNSDGSGDANFLSTDADGDGIPDSVEIGSDPSNPVDTDQDGDPDYTDTDSDDDGVDDAVEAGADPTNPADLDGNGIDDYLDDAFTGPVSVVGNVFVDPNTNGQLDAGESDISGVSLQLIDPGADGELGGGDDVVVATAVTASPFTFTGVVPGDYVVVADEGTLPAGMFPSGDTDGGADFVVEIVVGAAGVSGLEFGAYYGTISGTVVDASGEAIAGVTIRVTDSAGSAFTAVTSSDGRWSITGTAVAPIAPGALTISSPASTVTLSGAGSLDGLRGDLGSITATIAAPPVLAITG